MITVTSKWLLEHLEDRDLVIIDGRGNMPYRLGHIKNARYLGIEKVISLADNGANLVLDKSLAEELFSNLGIDDPKMVVVYGEYMDPSSSRIAWTLMYHGHPNTKLLDIGFDMWQKQGLPILQGARFNINTNMNIPVKFKSKPNHSIRADSDIIRS